MKTEHRQQIAIGSLTLLIVAAGLYGMSRWVKSRRNRTRSPKDKKKTDDRLIGREVHFGEAGYVNVRKQPVIDNVGVFDRSHNILKKASKNPVGTVLKRVSGEDGYSWYQIRLTGSEQSGYVREDVVTIT